MSNDSVISRVCDVPLRDAVSVAVLVQLIDSSGPVDEKVATLLREDVCVRVKVYVRVFENVSLMLSDLVSLWTSVCRRFETIVSVFVSVMVLLADFVGRVLVIGVLVRLRSAERDRVWDAKNVADILLSVLVGENVPVGERDGERVNECPLLERDGVIVFVAKVMVAVNVVVMVRESVPVLHFVALLEPRVLVRDDVSDSVTEAAVTVESSVPVRVTDSDLVAVCSFAVKLLETDLSVLESVLEALDVLE